MEIEVDGERYRKVPGASWSCSGCAAGEYGTSLCLDIHQADGIGEGFCSKNSCMWEQILKEQKVPASSIKVNLYQLITGTYEDAVKYGVHRAFKYCGQCPPDAEIERIVQEVSNALGIALCEVIDFEETDASIN